MRSGCSSHVIPAWNAEVALKKCRECDGRVSKGAKACPHCGAKKPARNRIEHGLHEASNALMGCGCLLVIIGFVAMMLLGFTVA